MESNGKPIPQDSSTFNIGDEVIDSNGNNAVVSEFFESECQQYDKTSKSFIPLDMSNKIKLKYNSGFTKVVDIKEVRKGKNTSEMSPKHILETVYEMDTSAMTQEKIDRLFTVITLYAEFYTNSSLSKIPSHQSWYSESDKNYIMEYNKNRYCFSSVLANLDIELSSSRIKDIYAQYGVIQLREFDSKLLTLGCVSGPLIWGATQAGFKEKHAHKNEITMSPELNFNPTVVGFFEGDYKFNNNYFEHVLFEGFFYKEIDSIIRGLTEAKRILAFNGKVTFDNSVTHRTFNRDQIDTIIEVYKNQPDFDIFYSNLPKNLTQTTLGLSHHNGKESKCANDEHNKMTGGPRKTS